MKSNSTDNLVAIFGEVLFDCFPDGNRVLGGAPFNVVWNLHGLGTKALFLSAIGNDGDGNVILDTMDSSNIERSGIHVHPSLPTGAVTVSIGDDGEPAYDINLKVAYDEISPKVCDKALLTRRPRLLYHGSLCFRTQENRDCLSFLKSRHRLQRFVDLNLREPWVNRDWLPLIVGDCRWLKLSIEELVWLSNSEVDATSESSIRSAILNVASDESVAATERTYLITCGENGAWWIDDKNCIHKPAAHIESFVDSVGAGDAFAAAVIDGIARDESAEDILERAVRFAARACSLQGATTNDRTHYRFDPATKN